MVKTFGYARQALQQWNRRQIFVATVAAVAVGLLIGIATVLIPNPVFARDIPPVWWNYPVWIITSVVSGMLLATYIRPGGSASSAGPGAQVVDPSARHGKFGMIGGLLSWFAVGCPVCNKLALIAFGYSGAITYFAPIQPFLAIAALLLTSVALLWRLKGQILCSMPPASSSPPHMNRETENTQV